MERGLGGEGHNYFSGGVRKDRGGGGVGMGGPSLFQWKRKEGQRGRGWVWGGEWRTINIWRSKKAPREGGRGGGGHHYLEAQGRTERGGWEGGESRGPWYHNASPVELQKAYFTRFAASHNKNYEPVSVPSSLWLWHEWRGIEWMGPVESYCRVVQQHRRPSGPASVFPVASLDALQLSTRWSVR